MRYLLAYIAIPLIILVGVNAGLLIYFGSLIHTSEGHYSVVELTDNVASSVNNSVVLLREFLRTSDANNQQAFEHSLEQLDEQSKVLVRHPYFPAELTSIIQQATSEYINASRNVINNDPQLVQSGQLNLQLNGLESRIDNALALIRLDAKRMTFSSYDRAETLGYIIVLAGIGITGITLLILYRRILLPLGHLKRALKQLGSGYFTTLYPSHKGELDDLITIFNESSESLAAAKQQLITANHKLSMANAELEAFSYSVSHDLRAPLRSISGFSETLERSYMDQLDGNAANYLQRIRKAAIKMGELIDEILKLSRLSRKELSLEHLNVSELAEEVTKQLLGADQGQSEVTIQPGLHATGDKGLTKVVLLNLLSNAVKFSSKQPSSKVRVGSTQKDGAQYLFVEDNGVGFNMKYVEKAVTAFQRLHTQQEFPGTGIGLATVQRIINKHGGELVLDSTQGEGTTVYFHLGEHHVDDTK